jgi:hypothetical protein
MPAGEVVVGVVAAVTFWPSAPTIHQTPATPSPFADPGALSCENRYSGCPAYTSWLPFGPATVVSLA